MATAGCLRTADPCIVGERVDLPDDRGLRPMPVVRRGFPQREQSGAQIVHHRLVRVGEGPGELLTRAGTQRDRLMQIQQGMAVILAHQPTGISSESTGREAFMSLRSVSIGATAPTMPAASSA